MRWRWLGGKFGGADVAQQVVGGFLLAGPFVVTEEVWTLAAAMHPAQAAGTVGLVAAIGYGALYQADRDREVDEEPETAGVPHRFVSLMAVAFGSVALMALLFAAPEVFADGPLQIAKAVSIGSVFSVVGAATADSVF